MRIPLVQGAYNARSIIAAAQRCVNLYPEQNPSSGVLELQGIAQGGVYAQAAVTGRPAAPMTYYPAPGCLPLATPSTPGAGRGLYWANSGDLYAVVGGSVYYVSPSWAFTSLGTIAQAATPVSMADNGTTLVLVDGTTEGYRIDLTTRAFERITSANSSPPSPLAYGFYGADRVDVIDGYLILNQPGTRNFYSTYTNEIVFDSLYFAAKNTYSDNLVTVIVTRRQIWLIGQRTTEVWFDAGASDFPFQIIPGPFIQHGCSAKYSVAQNDGAIYWLSQDQSGQNVLVRTAGYDAQRVSNHALEVEWSKYPVTNDAVGFCFQQNGHAFYQINFPSADRSWRYDESTQEWHEPVYTDANGVEHRHRAQVCAFAYGRNVVLDWETGALYALDPGTYTDNGQPMQFRRGFPHLMNDGNRVRYSSFTADVECGDIPGSTTPTPYIPLLQGPNQGIGNIGTPATPGTAPQILLRWSDDRGRTWSNPVPQSLGATGQYLTQPQWMRLGMARDRVFELFGTVPGQFALNGAFVDVQPCRT
jgi:hypothetical protein